MGIVVSDTDTRGDLFEKEKQFYIAREKIENTLESYYRSCASAIFQLNRRYLPKKMSIFRLIDTRFENSSMHIRLDEAQEEDWLMLIYLKNNNPEENIVVEDKSNPEKSFSKEYKHNEIFAFSDHLVNSLVGMIDRQYKKN